MEELTNKQKEALLLASKWWENERFDRPFVLSGLGGTGKTFIANRIAKELNLKDEQVKFVAYTGAAAGMLSKKGLDATTVHKAIYNPSVFEKEDEETGKKSEEVIFTLKNKEDFENIKLMIIDEGSMIDMPLFNDIKSFGFAIMILGVTNCL